MTRIGLVTKWFNSGQGVVSRHLRSALDELGHETFVLARQGKGRRSRTIDQEADPVWRAQRVTETDAADVPLDEYERWVEDNGIEIVLLDNVYGFDEVAALRRSGVRTVGRFVWEHFAREHVEPARDAYDVIYSLTRAEQERYRELGLDTPYVTWGCHPELVALDPGDGARHDGDEVRFLFPGGTLTKRKPLAEALEAFTGVGDPRLRLVMKGQLDKREGLLAEAVEHDPRIEIVIGDQPTDEHLRLIASCDVCLSPSRWEGLGIPLFEALAFGQPTITNDKPPMSEVVHDGVNGALVGSVADGEARSGITAWAPDVGELTGAIERLADDSERARLAAGARQVRDGERSWRRTVEDVRGLIQAVS